MKRKETGDSEVLAYGEPVGFGVIFTIPFFLGAIAFSLWFISLGGIGGAGGGDSLSTVIGLLVLVATIFWFVTAGRDWFGRVGVSIDRRDGMFRTGVGPILPVLGAPRPLGDFDGMVIDVVTRYRGSRISSMKHELYLSRTAGDRVRIGRAESYAPIRSMAEEVGAFLGLDVLDATRAEPVLLSADRLGKSLKEQAEADAPPVTLRDPPEGSPVVCSVQEGRATIDLPPEGLPGCFAVWLVFATAIAGFLIWFGQEEGKWGASAFFGGVAALVLGILLEFIAPSRTTLIADSTALTIRRKGLLRTGTTRVAAERVREASAEGCSVIVVWDGGRWTYGHRTLGEDGAAWVRDALRDVLGDAPG